MKQHANRFDDYTIQYKINKIGSLKYSRLECLSRLRKYLNQYDYNYTMPETKELLDSILSGDFDDEIFNIIYKLAFDEIFDNNEYSKISDTNESPSVIPQMIFNFRISIDSAYNQRFTKDEIENEIKNDNVKIERGLLIRKEDGKVIGEFLF